jgi:hypothetical protein
MRTNGKNRPGIRLAVSMLSRVAVVTAHLQCTPSQYISPSWAVSAPFQSYPRIQIPSTLPFTASKNAQFPDKKSQLDTRTSLPRNPR